MRDESSVESLRRQQRLVFRCTTTFLLDLVSRQIRRHDGDFTRAIIYMAAIQASRSPTSACGPLSPARAFSVRAIAQSMNLPYETTRRKIAELEALGLARRTGARGFTVAPESYEGPAYRADCEATWRAFRRVIADFRALNFDFSGHLGGTALAAVRDLTHIDLIDSVAVLSNDFLLRVLEACVEPHGSMMDATIFSTSTLLNAELLTNDPQLAWTYAGAETPPPDTLRTPASITDIAHALGLQHETVRRRVKQFCDRGWMKRVTGGYLICIERMQSPDVLQSGLMLSQRFLQLADSVHRLGVDLYSLTVEPAAS